jgi:nucleoside-diphosphate-sugar epimerase
VRARPILLTGHRGYIGSVLASCLLRQGYDVVGLDTGYFDACTLVPEAVEIPEIRKDLRDVVPSDLKAFYAIIHLAALSNDPLGDLDPAWTAEINHQASLHLAVLAREAEVRRFLFSSSCIMYGMAAAEVVDETSPLAPQTAYARSKVESELAIRELACDGFAPVFLRNGTVYGLSPRMRFDTVLNNLVGAAVSLGKVTVVGDGSPWRPVVQVEDVARAFHAVLAAPLAAIHNQSFNVGANHLNHQVWELAEIAAGTVPGCTLEVLDQPAADRRTYRADFTKFQATFPEVTFRSAASGARHLADELRRLGLTAADYQGPRFTRLSWLKHLLAGGRLDSTLRWQTPADR